VAVVASAVASGLAGAAAAFGPPAPVPARLRWGALFNRLDGRDDEEYVTAIELIYEGYLFHYRESRVCAAGADACRENALLAGDFLYARGLRLVAAHGDVAAVGLLARLMAACSCLRSLQAPFAADDALWASTVAGLAALRQGVAAAAVDRLFERVETSLARSEAVDVCALAREEALRLPLPDAAALHDALAALPSGLAA
jgi:hypothetical protein